MACHGCGFRWMKGWWIPLAKRFAFSCEKHDLYYDNHLYSRYIADLLFLGLMLKYCDRWWHAIVAWLYFILVRCFGWMTYYEKNRKIMNGVIEFLEKIKVGIVAIIAFFGANTLSKINVGLETIVLMITILYLVFKFWYLVRNNRKNESNTKTKG